MPHGCTPGYPNKEEEPEKSSDFAPTVETESGRPRHYPLPSPPAMLSLCYFLLSQGNQIHVTLCSAGPLSFKSPFHKLAQDVGERKVHGMWAVEVIVVASELGGFVFLCYFSSCPRRPESASFMCHIG